MRTEKIQKQYYTTEIKTQGWNDWVKKVKGLAEEHICIPKCPSFGEGQRKGR